MMKEEHWVVRSPLGSCVAIRHSSTIGAETGHIASHDKMGSTVYALRCLVRILEGAEGNNQKIAYPWTLEIRLETSKVANESV